MRVLLRAVGSLCLIGCGVPTADPKASAPSQGPGSTRVPAANAASASSGAGGASNALPREVRSASVTTTRWERTLSATGELAPFEVAELSSKVTGRVATIEVDLGSHVAAGAAIATLDARDQELRVVQAQAAVSAARTLLGLDAGGTDDTIDVQQSSLVRVAKAELDNADQRFKRAQELVKQDIGTQATLDTARAELDAAKGRLQAATEQVSNQIAVLAQRRADLEIARQALADTRIVAPFDGICSARMVARGDYLTPGTVVARLARVDPLRLRLEIPERDAAQVRSGQDVHVELEGVGGLHSGKLVRLSPVLAARNRTLTVEAELANADGSLRAGAFVRAQIVIDPNAQALSVPSPALVSFAGVDKVFVIAGDKVEERRVRIGRRSSERLEILEGLKEGEEVVLGPGNLQGGAAVRATR